MSQQFVDYSRTPSPRPVSPKGGRGALSSLPRQEILSQRTDETQDQPRRILTAHRPVPQENVAGKNRRERSARPALRPWGISSAPRPWRRAKANVAPGFSPVRAGLKVGRNVPRASHPCSGMAGTAMAVRLRAHLDGGGTSLRSPYPYRLPFDGLVGNKALNFAHRRLRGAIIGALVEGPVLARRIDAD